MHGAHASPAYDAETPAVMRQRLRQRLCVNGFDRQVDRFHYRTATRTMSVDITTIPVDSGATKQFWNAERIPGLSDLRKDYIVLNLPKIVATAGKRWFRGTTTGILCGMVVDQTGKSYRVRFPRLIFSNPHLLFLRSNEAEDHHLPRGK